MQGKLKLTYHIQLHKKEKFYDWPEIYESIAEDTPCDFPMFQVKKNFYNSLCEQEIMQSVVQQGGLQQEILFLVDKIPIQW